jgi:putative flippase GtrA
MTQAAQQASLASPAEVADGEFARYFIVSLAALCLDAAALFALTEGAGLHFLWANAAGFALGTAAAYLGSVRWVFSRRRVADRGLEFGAFAAIGVGGLLVNEAALWLGAAAAGFALPVAKLGAAGASFLFNYGVRRAMLFR